MAGEPDNVFINITGLSGYGLTGMSQVDGFRVALVGNPGSGQLWL
jgi:hypothetical protein